jgi:kinesin family protein 5
MSYYEIYCERIRDLLNPDSDNMKLRETKTDGFVIPGITEVFCSDTESVLRTIDLGKCNRATSATLMNAESSRSHSILSIQLTQTDDNTGGQSRSLSARQHVFIIINHHRYNTT